MSTGRKFRVEFTSEWGCLHKRVTTLFHPLCPPLVTILPLHDPVILPGRFTSTSFLRTQNVSLKRGLKHVTSTSTVFLTFAGIVSLSMTRD